MSDALNSSGRTPALQIAGLRQEFPSKRGAAPFIVCVEHLALPEGEFVAVQGPNGCGKTTLVTVLALLRSPSNLHELGEFRLNLPENQGNGHSENSQVDVKALWASRWNRFRINALRRQYIGFAPQQLELLPVLKVHETIGGSLWLNGTKRRERKNRIQQLLDKFGLTEAKVTGNRVNDVSGGQQQKTTLARAIAHHPPLIFLDEPTAYLYHKDAREALEVLKELQETSAEEGRPVTVVMITHDNVLAKDFATTVIRMDVRNRDGYREGYITSVAD